MAKLYNKQSLESFVNAIISVNSIIDEQNPDIVFAPMMGTVPIIDALNVVNPYFDNSRVFYVPASSSLSDLNRVLPETAFNVLQANAHYSQDGLKIMSVDEIVSGNSIVRINKRIATAVDRYAHELSLSQEQSEAIKFYQVGLEDQRFVNSGKPYAPGYQHLKSEGLALAVPVARILTMDNPLFCPVRYIPKPDSARKLPVIDDHCVVSREYVELLADIATTAGTDPDQAVPKNLNRIFEHQQYVPESYKK